MIRRGRRDERLAVTGRRSLGGCALVAVVLAAAACSSSATSGKGPAATTSTTRPQYRPVYAKGACPGEVPESPRIECGTLTVPENRSDPEGRKVVLPVGILRTADPHPAPDPVVYFSGGPGDAGLPTLGGFLENGWAGNRDVIIFDQRGTGDAQPSLACPEVYDANAANNAEAGVRYDVAQQRFEDAVHACAERLRAAGVDLDRYNTRAVADDAADLRAALGIKQWNLFGVSYGTTVALDTMRTHPEGIRSVVIDSVFPPDVEWNATTTVAGFARVQRVFFDGCAKDPACHARYPNLEADFRAAVAELDAHPYHTRFTDPFSKKTQPFVIDGATAITGFFQALYDSDLIPVLPSVIEQIKAGTAGPILDALVQQLGPNINSAAEAQHQAVNCSDRADSVRDDDVPGLLADNPDYSRLLITYTVCSAISVAPAPPGFDEQVRSNIPTLVLGDEYDPVTPPDDSRRTAQALSNATFVLFPGLGHGAVFSGRPCPVTIFRAFLAAPATPVDASCVGSMSPPKWSVG
jgi:pimeloyl-ACP methyl ester carboxylesterase